MTNLSPEAQSILDAANSASSYGPDDCLNDAQQIAVAALRALIDKVVPEETEAPRAVFDCEPTLKNSKGELRHDHGAHLRRQFRQEELDIRWEQRRQTRALMLVVVTELEAQ